MKRAEKRSKEGPVVTEISVTKVCACGEELKFTTKFADYGSGPTVGYRTCACGREYRVSLCPSKIEPTTSPRTTSGGG
jgi:hypothetical protein